MKFTAHNIQLNNGNTTREGEPLLSETQTCKAFIRALNGLFPEEKRTNITVVDLGCLEGGYSVEFARQGYRVLGIEARQTNIDKCEHVLCHVDLPNLRFERDDVKNLEQYGPFDVVFCCGLFYHLDNPCSYLSTLSKTAKKMLMLHTHYALREDPLYDRRSGVKESIAQFISGKRPPAGKHNFHLSALTHHEGKQGRWYSEYAANAAQADIEQELWTSYSNYKSFWLTKNDLLQSVREAGFPLVYEQYDFLDDISTDKYIEYYDRSLFIGVKPD